VEPQQRIEAARYRRIRVALDAITLPAPGLAMPELLAMPGAMRAASRMRAVVAQPNVVAVGIAQKVTAGQPTGELALTFYVEEKRDVSRADAVPPMIPGALVPPRASTRALSGASSGAPSGASSGAPSGVPTDVVELGRITPEVLAQDTPIVPGFSIGHPDVTAGTLGALLGPRTRPRILGNSHVLANSGLATIGDPIVYPGPMDGGDAAHVVAHLSQAIPFDTSGAFVNSMDAAVATVVPARRAELRSRIALLGLVPSGTTLATRGMQVVKAGRTTGLTHGEVRDVNFRFALDYGSGVGSVGFTDQVLCTRYTAGGDSGSLVLEEGSGRAVGLHFAGANGGSVFSPIRPILRAVRGRLIRTPLNEA
jgi:hypothetical protein